jgi:hypothetical protein
MDGRYKKKHRGLAWWLAGILLAGTVIVGAESNSTAPTNAPAAATSQQQVQTQQAPQTDLSNNSYYRNSDGDYVHSPAYSEAVPAGASAQCEDATYSFSQHRQGTCSRHGGVEQWLN